jgi:hypothetical protein
MEGYSLIRKVLLIATGTYRWLLMACVAFTGLLPLASQQLAFPGADGFGRFTTGGRGGVVIEVTNLNDKGPGSFREAVNTSGPRTIVFRVSGTIWLESDLRIKNDDLTIAGQTAPGDGITLANYNFYIDADNVIVRYIRSRLGDVSAQQADAFSCHNTENVIIDHCSFSWGVDEVASSYSNKNFTMQYCIISESLYFSVHDKQEHGYGGIWGGSRASFHHNLIAHNSSRNPRFNGARYNRSPWEEIVDYRYNVIYNWGFNSAYGGEPSELDGIKAKINVVKNYYKAGPATRTGEVSYRIVSPDQMGSYGFSDWYVDSNVTTANPAIFEDNWEYGVQGVSAADKLAMRSDTPFEYMSEVHQTAEEAYADVLANAGCILPRPDTVDLRIKHEVMNGIATFGGAAWGAGKGIIDSQEDVGSWPDLFQGRAPIDSDHDGMPDDWEDANGLNKNDPEDRNGDLNGNGYTNLEDYLNSITTYPVFVNPPTLFNAELSDVTVALLQWKDNCTNESGFYLERNDGDGFFRIDTLDPDITSFTDTTLDFSTTYSYRVMAFTETDSSIYATSEAVTTPAETDPPQQAYDPCPENNATLVGINPILSWSAGLGAESHKFFFGTENPPPLINTQTDKFYHPGTLEMGTTYYWQVVETNKNGETEGPVWKFTTTIDLSNRLVGHWALESVFTSVDSSFFANHGTPVGFQPFSSTIPGAVGKAVNFNGSSEYITVPHHDIFDFGTGSFTVSLWLKQTESTISGPKDFTYLIKGSHLNNTAAGTSGKRYELYFDGGSKHVRFELDDHTNTSYVMGDGLLFLTGEWVHLTAIRDTINQQLRLYLNGELLNAATDNTGDISQGEDLVFAFGSDYPTYLPGALDDIRLYNYILNQSEIEQLTGMGPVGTISSTLENPIIRVYPNPANEELNIRLYREEAKDINIELIQLPGKIIQTKPEMNDHNENVNITISTSHLNPGYYILRIKTGAGTFNRKVLIIN